MLQIWKWLSNNQTIFAYSPNGIDCVISKNDSTNLVVVNSDGKAMFTATLRELKSLASFQGYHNPNTKVA